MDSLNSVDIVIPEFSIENALQVLPHIIPYVIVFAIVFALVLVVITSLYRRMTKPNNALTTLSQRHFSPEAFYALGNHSQLLAFRTGFAFVLLGIRMRDKKLSRKQNRELAFCLSDCLREDDILGCYGRGKFKVLLPYLAETIDYEIVLQRIRSKIVRTSVAAADIEVSVTSFPDGGSTFKKMLVSSDRSFLPL